MDCQIVVGDVPTNSLPNSRDFENQMVELEKDGNIEQIRGSSSGTAAVIFCGNVLLQLLCCIHYAHSEPLPRLEDNAI